MHIFGPFISDKQNPGPDRSAIPEQKNNNTKKKLVAYIFNSPKAYSVVLYSTLVAELSVNNCCYSFEEFLPYGHLFHLISGKVPKLDNPLRRFFRFLCSTTSSSNLTWDQVVLCLSNHQSYLAALLSPVCLCCCRQTPTIRLCILSPVCFCLDVPGHHIVIYFFRTRLVTILHRTTHHYRLPICKLTNHLLSHQKPFAVTT